MSQSLKARITDWLEPEKEGGGRFGVFEAGVLITACVGLSVMQFGGSEWVFRGLFGETLQTAVRANAQPGTVAATLGRAGHHPWFALYGLLHWVTFCFIGFVAIPVFWLKVNGRKVSDYYIGFGGFFRHFWVYAGLFLAMLPVLIIASRWAANQNIYPFYPLSGRSWFDLCAWELAYGLQFFALEFFFRGFLLQGLRKWVGYAAVFIMLVPYCMLHFQKTFTESLASLVAGLILGTLAMKYRSVWGGVMVHWGVAVTMDLLSLMHKDNLPTKFWPDL